MKRIVKNVLLLALLAPCTTYAEKVTPATPREWAFENLVKYTAEAEAERDENKLANIESLRAYYHKNGHQMQKYLQKNGGFPSRDKAQGYLDLLNEEGVFTDLVDQEAKLFPSRGSVTKEISASKDYMTTVWNRLSDISIAVFAGNMTAKEIYVEKYLKAIIHYGYLELDRDNYTSRFHNSCFALPQATSQIYFTLIDEMERIESGECSELEAQACEMLKVVGLQTWTQPLRNDYTDDDVTSVERFQHHVWWVGGNGLAFRPVLPVACMLRSIPMVDVLAEVSQGGLSVTSQNTFETSFWSEGFTADGAGWGHGMQCYVWGYPISGTSSALSMLSALQGTEWAKSLSDENKASLLNFIQGSNWYYYKGYDLPCLDRHSYSYENVFEGYKIKSAAMVKTLRDMWADSFSRAELDEITQFCDEAEQGDIEMEGYPAGVYTGTRYFFNNDDLIKNNSDYHIIVNMSSVRCDGTESFSNFHDEYNLTTCDGMTLFQKEGNEYKRVLGAWDVLRAPGVTARLGMDRFKKTTNWRGYCSMHNFAGAATNGSKNAVAGYEFEKMNASAKKNVNDPQGVDIYNEILYGVKAYKSYFMFGDYMMALGAGVTNSTPEVEGDIHTSIEQTASENRLFIYECGKQRAIEEGVQKFGGSDKSLQWLVQEGKFAYAPLPAYSPDAYYTSERRKTDWIDRNISNRARSGWAEEVDVLQIWADHGAAPKDDTYGYVVYAGDNLPAAKLPFEVLRNDTRVQAAATTSRDVIEAVFYDSSESLTVSKKMTIQVSEPCILILEQSAKGEYQMAVTDPTMNASLTQITVTINGTPFTTEMPTGDQCGKPAVTTIKL